MRHWPVSGEADVTLAVGVLDAFISWVELNSLARTFEWHKRHCQKFVFLLPKNLSVRQL